MSAATDARMSSLDRMLDDGKVGDNFASEMFAVVDLLDSSATLRRAVTDPGTPEGARRALVHGLLDRKVDKAVADELAEEGWPARAVPLMMTDVDATAAMAQAALDLAAELRP